MDQGLDLIDLIDIGHSLNKTDVKKLKGYFSEIKDQKSREDFLRVDLGHGTDLMFWANRTNHLSWLFDKFINIGKIDLVDKYYPRQPDLKPQIPQQQVSYPDNRPAFKFLGYFPNYPIHNIMHFNIMHTSAYYSYKNNATGQIHQVPIGYIPSSYLQ